MRRRIQTILMVTLAFCCFGTSAHAQAAAKRKANKATQEWRYEIEAAGVGSQGTYLVKVYSYSKNKNVAIEQCKKNAVHGVIFKGLMANEYVRSGQKPLITNPEAEAEHAVFFEDFFKDGGNYMQYVNASTDATHDLAKVGKEYKIGVIVSVNIAALRKSLEAAGVVRGLSGGF